MREIRHREEKKLLISHSHLVAESGSLVPKPVLLTVASCCLCEDDFNKLIYIRMYLINYGSVLGKEKILK